MNGKRVMKTKQPVALVALLLLLCCTVAGTLAYLVTSTDPVTNTFTPAEVKTEVTESFVEDKGELVKSNVQIKNNGNIDAYIRAAVIINWADANGNVYGGGTPAASTDDGKSGDYIISFNTDDWKQIGDYWYCETTTAPGALTKPLIISCAKTSTATVPDGYDLQVTILADGIQAEPVHVVADVWKDVRVDGGKLVDATATKN